MAKDLTVQQLLADPKTKCQIKMALPSHMTAERMARIALTEFRLNAALQRCNPTSFLGAVLQASQLGLELGSKLGHAYLIPYKNEVTLQIGYRGMIDLARRSGSIQSICARVVHEKDVFNFSYGLNEHLEHTPCSSYKDRGAFIAVYAIARLKDGGYHFEVMFKEEVDAIRENSPGKNSAPWREHYEEMAKKTVIRRLFKYLPVSIELQKAVAIDELADAGISQENEIILGIVDEPAEPSTDSLAQKAQQIAADADFYKEETITQEKSE